MHCALLIILNHEQGLDVDSEPNYRLLAECIPVGPLSLACQMTGEGNDSPLRGAEGEGKVKNYGLVWTLPSGENISDDGGTSREAVALVSGNEEKFSTSLRRHPVKAYAPHVRGAPDSAADKVNTAQSKNGLSLQEQTVRIIQIRSVKLAQQVTALSAQHQCTHDLVFELSEGCRDTAMLELGAVACEWFVLAEALLACGQAEVENRDNAVALVDVHLLSPLCTVIDKLDMFASLGVHLDTSPVPATAEHPALEWGDFVSLQEVSICGGSSIEVLLSQ